MKKEEYEVMRKAVDRYDRLNDDLVKCEQFLETYERVLADGGFREAPTVVVCDSVGNNVSVALWLRGGLGIDLADFVRDGVAAKADRLKRELDQL